mgnify:FL=1
MSISNEFLLPDYTHYMVVYNKEFYTLQLWDITIPSINYKIIDKQIYNEVDIPNLMHVIREEIMKLKEK